MRRVIYIALFFSSCTGALEDVSPANPCSLFAVLESGKTPTVDIICAESNDSEFPRLEWFWSDGSSDLFVASNNHRILSSDRKPQPGETVALHWEDGQHTTEIPLQFPPAISLETLSDDTLSTDSDESIEVQWSDLGADYEYVLALDCTEENADSINQQVGDFDMLYAGPQLLNTLSLESQNFTFKGAHRLMIYALNRAYTDVYFEDPSDIRGLLKMPEGNLQGANGYVLCVTALEVQIVVE
jgi:hypothetical protein